MQVKDEFNRIAVTYDTNRRKFIPCFDGFYVRSTDFLATEIIPPRRILDLGAGTGLLTYYWMKHFPDAEYTLVDAADEMLGIARQRFCGRDHMLYKVADYMCDSVFSRCDAVISALSVHHLEDRDKLRLFERIYKALPVGGLFVNYDQFCADDAQMNVWMNNYWEDYVMHSGLDDAEILRWRSRQQLDRECSVPREICMLTDGARFDAAECIFLDKKFAVIVAIKK